MISVSVTKYLDDILAQKKDRWYYSDETQPSHMRWMLKNLISFTNEKKQNRWLGYVQGVMTARRWITVTKERDRIRPYFVDEDL